MNITGSFNARVLRSSEELNNQIIIGEEGAFVQQPGPIHRSLNVGSTYTQNTLYNNISFDASRNWTGEIKKIS